jgi:4-aminobutyrate aminotransferase
MGFLGGFHGRTMGAVTFTASKNHYHKGFFPLMNGVVHVPFPDPYHPLLHSRAGEGYGETVVRYMEEEILGKILPADEVAGVLIEPIQGEGGYILPAPDFFPALRRLCDKHGILMIVDEVQAGMGRTGKWWSIQHFGVEPDIVCAAKGIASGVPLGAMIARKRLMTWPKGAHGNTYGGNPLACAAALATIDLIQTEYLENAARMGELALERLGDLAEEFDSIGQVRGMGLMIGVEFVKDSQSRLPAEALRDRVVDRAFEKGLLLLGCGKSVVRISPPLCLTAGELEEGLQIFAEAVREAEAEG